jgi:quinoprotein glucose dehydrogenase
LLAEIAGRADLPEAVRLQAVTMLGEWERPSGRDKVMGLWRPIPARPASPAIEALRPKLQTLLASGLEAIVQEVIRAVGTLAMKEASPLLRNLAANDRTPEETLSEVLKTLAILHDPGQADLARRILRSGAPRARVEAVRVLFLTDPLDARAAVDRILETGTPFERQGVFAILADHPYPAADEVLLAWLDRLLGRKVPPEIQLDVIAAAEHKPSPAVRARLEEYEASRSETLPHEGRGVMPSLPQGNRSRR